MSLAFGIGDKCLGRKANFGMRMYPNDLPSADTGADGYCFISCVRPSVQLSVSLDFDNEDKSLGRKKYHGPSVRPFTAFSGF